MNKKFNILNEQINRVEKRLLKLESRKTAKEELFIVLKSGYTKSDLNRLYSEIESGEKGAVFEEIVKELNTHNDTCNYYKSLSKGNLFECNELDKDLLDVINNLI